MIEKKNPLETAGNYQKAASFLSRTYLYLFKTEVNIMQEVKQKKTCKYFKTKSSPHRKIQEHLLSCIPDLVLEKRFTEIGRIGDAVWEKEKIVFEIQVSPISKNEVKKRVADYAKAGFHVVWILHQKTFGKKRIQDGERSFFRTPCYYTNIDGSGKVKIYDKARICLGKMQFFLSVPIILSQFIPMIPPRIKKPGSKMIAKRSRYPFYFKGDYFCLYLNNPSLIANILEKEKEFRKKLWWIFFRNAFTSIKNKFFSFITLFFLDKNKKYLQSLSSKRF